MAEEGTGGRGRGERGGRRKGPEREGEGMKREGPDTLAWAPHCLNPALLALRTHVVDGQSPVPTYIFSSPL